MQFEVKTINNQNIKDELLNIGFDTGYIDKAVLKHEFLTLKIKNLTPECAAIIKQTALSKGTDAAVNRGVLSHSVSNSDLILSGTKKQLEDIADSLFHQPFSLSVISKKIKAEINRNKKNTPVIMGILNITDDSFSDGGKFLEPDKAIAHAYEMINDGAQIIDIGAESTRPGAKPVNFETEIKRITPVIKEIKGVEISIDTRNSKTAEKMIELGADIINDVSNLEFDPKMKEIALRTNAGIILTHSKGTPETMDKLTEYDNLSDEIFTNLLNKTEELINLGKEKEKIIIDTGFGFAKNIEQNFELLRRINEFNSIGVRQLAGASRKRFLKSLNCDADDLTMLSSFYFAQKEIDILRVHNVKKTKTALEFYKKISF